MANTCSQYLFLFLLCLSTSPPLSVEASTDRLRHISVYRMLYSMEQADAHCKSVKNGSLAIAWNEFDVEYFTGICSHWIWKCWVGLKRTPNGVWRWNDGHNNSLPVQTWSLANSPDCAIVSNGQLIEYACPQTLYFICENNHLVLVKEEKTWEEALHHCRALGSDASKQIDLVSFHDQKELSYAQEMAQARTEEVWIGLRWLAGRWLWMDQTASGVISLAECPANGNHCGTLSGGGQQARNCVEKRRFFCLKQAN